jgi:PAS domain S-box-containing protein/putative nucleotidyltransferase with HDIG domain
VSHSHTPRVSRSRRATATRTARGAGSCAVTLGLLVLAGWVLAVSFLKGPFPGLVQIKANTAIGLLALGIALLLTTPRPSPTRRRAARLLASLAIVIGALTLGEDLLGRNLGLHQLIFRDVSVVHTVHPGGPALQTAITFILLGSALRLLQTGTTKTRLVSALTGSSFVLALSAVIGDAFGVPGLDGAPRITPIALLTQVVLLLLCAGIAARDPDGVFVEVLTSDDPGSAVARRLLPLALVLLPAIGWLGLQGQQNGLYSAAQGAALRVLVTTVVLALAILSLTRRLNRLELDRRRAAGRAVRLAALVDAANEAIASADPDGIITTWNRAAEKLFGYREEEIIHQPISVLSPPDAVAEQRRLIVAATRGDASTECDTQRLHRDGSRLEVSVTVSPIIHDGSLTGFCAMYRDITERLRARDALENTIGERTRELWRSRDETLQKLALAAEYRDDDTFQHTERVGASAEELATKLGLPASLVGVIRRAASLHDIGKIGIPDRILLKPGPLTQEEFDAIKQHTVLGAGLLAGSGCASLQLAEQIALTHHERWDGDGYPAGLAGEAIPIAGRIVAVVDSFDAMAYDRPYRVASSVEYALGEIDRCRGTQFDPHVVKAFLQLHRHGAPTTDSEPHPAAVDKPASANTTTQAPAARTRAIRRP